MKTEMPEQIEQHQLGDLGPLAILHITNMSVKRRRRTKNMGRKRVTKHIKRRRRCRKKPRTLRFLLDGLSLGRLSPHSLSFTPLGCRRQLLFVPRE